MIVGAMMSLLLRWYLMKENERKERTQDSDEAARKRVMDIDHIGDTHPDFMYYL